MEFVEGQAIRGFAGKLDRELHSEGTAAHNQK
jgi:hypothetical protein